METVDYIVEAGEDIIPITKNLQKSCLMEQNAMCFIPENDFDPSPFSDCI
jgi:hypothetical protein